MLEFYHSFHIKHRFVFLSLVFITVLAALFYFVYPLRAVEIYPSDDIVPLDSGEIKIKFNRPIIRKSLQPIITPDIPGEWKFADPLISGHLYTSIMFVPFQTLAPDTEYQAHLGNIDPFLSSNKYPIGPIVFKTLPLPDADKIENNPDNPLPPSAIISVKFNKPIDKFTQIRAIFSPAIETEEVWDESKIRLSLQPKNGFSQGIDYDLEIERSYIIYDRENSVLRKSEPEKILLKSFSIVKPAGVSEITPLGNEVLPSVPIKIKFLKSMVRDEVEKNFSINPPLNLKFNWLDDQSAEIIADPALSFGTKYQLYLPAAVHASDGATLEKEIKHNFSTIGQVSIISFDPENNSQGVAVSSPVSIKFNQEVDKASAEEKIKFYPETALRYEWSDNTAVIVHPISSLSSDGNYIVNLESGIKSVAEAPESAQFSFSFKTEPEIFKLNIPMDYQDKKLSCEAAALKMALFAKGVRVSENDIMKIVGYDPTKRSNGIWGNPNGAFVGDINGKQNTTGFGVYWGPIARAAKKWRPDSESFTNWTLEKIIAEVANGNPVEFWGVVDPAKQDSWKTPAGETIDAWKGEHTRTLVGFIGSRINPRTLIINDPLSGILYWPKEKFSANWSHFNNSGVVVR